MTLSATWQALVLVRKQGEWQAYLNDEPLTILGDADPTTPSLTTFIGGENLENESGFQGLIDNASFYERALNVHEIQALLSEN